MHPTQQRLAVCKRKLATRRLEGGTSGVLARLVRRQRASRRRRLFVACSASLRVGQRDECRLVLDEGSRGVLCRVRLVFCRFLLQVVLLLSGREAAALASRPRRRVRATRRRRSQRRLRLSLRHKRARPGTGPNQRL
eukprot:2461457-Pleurochrysis_carterae.AAC.2